MIKLQTNREIPEDSEQEETDMAAIMSHLLDPIAVKDRTVRLFGPILLETSYMICASIHEFEKIDPQAPITLVINSPGGSVYEMLAIYDAMTISRCPIRTIGIGSIMSAATLVVAAGTPGERYLTPHTSVMMHEISGAAFGRGSDIATTNKELQRLQKIYMDLMKKHTGKTKAELEPFTSGSDSYMSAKDAIRLGLADKILKNHF